jgi:hypothetical protein
LIKILAKFEINIKCYRLSISVQYSSINMYKIFKENGRKEKEKREKNGLLDGCMER